jgi:hypothetical protein
VKKVFFRWIIVTAGLILATYNSVPPDGQVIDEKAPVSETSSGMGVKEAVKTRAFWAIGFSTMMQMMAIHMLAISMLMTSAGLLCFSHWMAVPL